MVTERGTSFGYHNLVVDMRGLVIMRALGHPVVVSTPRTRPASERWCRASGGQREFAAPLARRRCVGIDAVFMEVHPDRTTPRATTEHAAHGRCADVIGHLVTIHRAVHQLSDSVMIDRDAILAQARETLAIESAAIACLQGRLGEEFAAAVEALLGMSGRAIVCGIASPGPRPQARRNPRQHRHARVFHARSRGSAWRPRMLKPRGYRDPHHNSGETEEIVSILPLIKRRGAATIAIIGRATHGGT